MNDDPRMEWVAITVIGRDRPGIVANVSGVLYRHRSSIEELSQTVIRGQFAMILIASLGEGASVPALKGELRDLSRDLDLDIDLRRLKPEDLIPYQSGETEPFIITARGKDRPGLVYGITELLAERGINITNLGAQVARLGQELEYIQVFEVDIPKNLDYGLLQEKIHQRGQEMGVSVDLQHKDIFRAINQI
ncbi:MAG TPA: ACT domain-containing protein [Thermodesulfobacteriota bacterium]|nr:ACT domain-containing protein [Thermodesulfobacteriota bacterium]